jgi:hypothetical protein
MRFGMPLWAAAAAVVLAPVAHADALDDQFINSLASQGIWGDRGQLINDGQATCDNYGTPGMNGLLFQIMGLGLDNVQASRVMIVGLRAYCPEKAAAGTMAAMLGPGSAAAPADPNPTEEQLVQLSIQSAPATCKTLSYVSDADGVRGAIDGVMGKTGLPEPAAERVVARSVADSCPQYKPLVKQVASSSP